MFPVTTRLSSAAIVTDSLYEPCTNTSPQFSRVVISSLVSAPWGSYGEEHVPLFVTKISPFLGHVSPFFSSATPFSQRLTLYVVPLSVMIVSPVHLLAVSM